MNKIMSFKAWAGNMFVGVLYVYNGTHTFFSIKGYDWEGNALNVYKKLTLERVA